MSLPRRDRLYERPRNTQHAWMLEGEPPEARMRQVFILAWRRHSYRWSARVVYTVDVQGSSEAAVVQRWVPLEVLRPVKSDPNILFGIR